MIALTLPYPPSVNNYLVNVGKRRVLSAEARAYKETAAWAIVEQVGRPELMTGPVALTLRLYRPRKNGDASNRVKIVEDLLTGTVFADDEQVVELHVYRADDKTNPRVEVEITEVPL